MYTFVKGEWLVCITLWTYTLIINLKQKLWVECSRTTDMCRNPGLLAIELLPSLDGRPGWKQRFPKSRRSMSPLQWASELTSFRDVDSLQWTCRDKTNRINNQNSIILYPFYILLGLSIVCTFESRGHENTTEIIQISFSGHQVGRKRKEIRS